MSVLDRRAKQNHQHAPSSSLSLSSGSPSTNKTAPGLAHTSDLVDVDLDFSADGSLPDVHPSLVEYLNQEAVRRALKHRDATITITDRKQTSSCSFADINLDGHHLPDPSESRCLSYLAQRSAGTDSQTSPHSSVDDENRQRPGGPELISSHAEGGTTNTTHSNIVFDYNSRDSGPSTFNPESAEIGSSNRVFTNVDWFSFMRDCGIMDIEDD